MGILTDEMKQVVERQRLGFVATVCPDGTPNLSPKGTVSFLDNDHLVFADVRSPGTVANLRQNPGIEVNIVDPFLRKGYRFKGKAEVLDAGAEFERLVEFFANRGMFDAPRRIRTIVVIKVDQAHALISPGYDRQTDEASMRAYWVKYYLGDNEAASTPS
ncbi:MAG: pyridoxamine 5'-phosphate oxidase family protein [Acidobacteria bacterium]|nr:pyridoxamine 5'-phosphate oxidase family protein [Acidobacteriota bacterium]